MPKSDVDIHILNENGKEVKDGIIGEILISGKSVASGYVGKKREHTFITYKKKRAYYTGDLGYKKNGILYFVGRIDEQVKYKGYRIELSDIENNLYKIKYIERVKVVAFKNEKDIVNRIIAFIKLKDNSNKNGIDIRKDMHKVLPIYMMPGIEIVDEFKLNKNGKIDVHELRRIVDGR